MKSTLYAVACTSMLAFPVTTLRAQSLCDYEPTSREVILNTESTTVVPKSCAPYQVRGGVFVFHNVKIPAGVTVRGTGSNPMIWVVTGDFVVDGTLSVDGGDGERVNTLNSANFPAAGGAGVCSGGDGGRGSPSVTGQSPSGERGYGPLQTPAFGGGGGLLSFTQTCNRGSGGGGGSFATQGDPYYKMLPGAGSLFPQPSGVGGFGCTGACGSASRTLPGGVAGTGVFADARLDNDFFGLAFDVRRRLWILGELPLPVGGSGGGGGGDRSLALGATNWINDNKGGGGGGGGGALLILALGKIEVGASGHISADGGNGGGGEQAGGNNQGGGGGGGSGGMLLLYSPREIVLWTHGETYANNDYDFALSADGGIGTQSIFGGVGIAGKYPPPATACEWDQNPTGGFGGLGLIQLFARPGSNADGTNTILDDNVHVVDAATGQRLSGAQKQRYLAWRGFPDQNGVGLDDSGTPTSIGANEGDLRPTPILQPIL